MEAQYEEDLIYSKEELGQIREVSDDIFNEMNLPSTKLVSRELVYHIYLALLISIPLPNVFNYFKEVDNNNDPQKYLQDLYDDLLNTPKPSKRSRDFSKRVESSWEYYEKSFRLRSKIQNYEYNYHNLGSTTANFLQGREKVKIQREALRKGKKGDICCLGCNTKWLNNDKDNCPICEKEEDINMFIILANFFCVVGDMSQFYSSLHHNTYEYLCDHWNDLKTLFKRKNKDKNTKWWTKMTAEYGRPQYNKIIKLDGGDWKSNKDFLTFNSKYKLALTPDMEELDLREAKNVSYSDFTIDLSNVEAPPSKKIKMPEKKINLDLFKPKMENLVELHANYCGLRTINLDPSFFPSLTRLYLQHNDIEYTKDIISLIKIKSLRLIDVLGNPIEKSNEIYNLEEEFQKFNIEVRYNPNKKYLSRAKIDEESDPEVKKILQENIDFDVSESSSSIPNQDKLKKKPMQFPPFNNNSN